MLRVLYVVFFALALFACERSEPDAIPNVRLGMTPRDVRDRFDPSSTGAWQTSVGTGDDTVLEWTSRGAKIPESPKVARVRFEFHLGMLVAIRARTTENEGAERVSATPKTVTVRRPDPEGGTSIVVLARDCPTHKDEAESLASRTRN